ncbi:hypothetical protein [Vannielia sp. SX4]|uniref:hypothetical protein n=1 Tax=Vannielia sp. SX4 TaxID=3463852 RepID=UPI0040595102
MPDALTLTWLVTAVAVPALGYVGALVLQRLKEVRDWRIARLDEKIRDVYAPLYADAVLGEAIWTGFAGVRWPAHGMGGYDPDGPNTTDEERENWRVAVRELFMPVNERMEARILAHAHLLAEPEIKPLISRFLLHVSGYRLIIEAWEEGDFSRHTSLVEFPAGIRAVLETRLAALMAEQDRHARRWLF